MDFQRALAIAKRDPELEKKIGKGYYLSSAVCVTSEKDKVMVWTLVYSLPGSYETINVTVSDKVELSESVQNTMASRSRLDVSRVKTSLSVVLEKARQIAKGYNKKITKEIISLYQDKDPVWRMVFFTTALDIIILEFNALTGEKISERLDSMLKVA